MGLKVLLHVVGSGELLLAAVESALNSLLGSVDLGVTRGMTRSGEGLLATVAVAVAARVSLARAFRQG